MDATTADPLVGVLLDGRYRIRRRIARGGMATVYQAIDTRLERIVAIKIIHPEFAGNEAFRSRFDREAKTVAGLTHPNVVAVFDSGRHDGLPYLVMEYVPGRTLRDVLTARGRLSPTEALEVAEPMLAALAAAHRAGLVHRDVKPENILIGEPDGPNDGPLHEPIVKVADFGLARAVEQTSDETGGQLMATVAYVPPELVRTGHADTRSDVYSAGIVLFELVTGSVPFRGDDPTAVAYQHVEQDVPAPSSVLPGLPSALDEIIGRATRRDPEQRPADAGALLSRLRAARGDIEAGVRTVAHHTVLLPTARRPDRESEPVEAWQPRRPRIRRGALAAAIVVVVLGLVAGVGGWWLGAGRYTQAPSLLAVGRQTAEHRAEQKGFHLRWAPAQFSETTRRGTVLSQDPQPGGRVLSGGTITVVLSKGPERHTIPRLAGTDAGDASRQLGGWHLTVHRKQAYSSSVDIGDVISVQPKPGTVVRPGASVTLTVSKGAAPATVPDLTGMSSDDAEGELSDMHLDVKVVQKESESVDEGDVISQRPKPGTGVELGATVTIVVSSGPPKVEVPDVTGMKYGEAKKKLSDAGFEVRGLGIPTDGATVRKQTPDGGSQEPKGSTITLWVI